MNLTDKEMINLVANGKHAIIAVECISINTCNTNRIDFSVIHAVCKVRVTTARYSYILYMANETATLNYYECEWIVIEMTV